MSYNVRSVPSTFLNYSLEPVYQSLQSILVPALHYGCEVWACTAQVQVLLGKLTAGLCILLRAICDLSPSTPRSML